MKRVPAELVLFALRQEGYDIAEVLAYVESRTRRNTQTATDRLTAGHAG